MPAHPTTRPRPRHHLRPVLGLLAALTALAALVLPSTGAAAGPATTTADRIVLTVDGLDLPAAPGTPELLVAADEPFTVTVSLYAGQVPAPYSTRSATDVRVTVDGRTLTTATVPAGQSSATVDGLRLPAANGVTLTASAVARKAATDLRPGTAGPFDVVLSADTVVVPATQRTGSLFVNATGVSPLELAQPCTATPEAQTCVDVLLPNGVESDVFFSTGLCSTAIGCLDDRGLVLQVLADLGEDATALYTPTAPATLIVRCDKTRCGGGGVPSSTLQVRLEPTGALEPSPACSAKGFMSGPDGHCVDYVQSRRDGTGDTYLYLLITRDARMSW